MTLKEMPKVGDKVRYIGGKGAVNRDVTYGTIYKISEIYRGDTLFIDDTGEEETVIREHNFDKFEIVDEGTPVEASPTVIELLTNISRRLYEAEQTIKTQAHEINELYKAVSE